MNEIRYECRWSSDLTPVFVDDFCRILNETWKGQRSPQDIQRRYVDNYYGESLLIVAYVDGAAAGTQAFWRNDISGRKSYQSGDSAVLTTYQGRGIFKTMLKKGMALLSEDALFYGWPNNNSKPAFLSIVWKVLRKGMPVLFFSSFDLLRPDSLSFIDYDYAKWYLKSCGSHIFSIKQKKKCYLVLLTKHRCIVQLLGICDENTASLFERIKNHPLMLYYKSSHIIDNSQKGQIVVMHYNGENIPVWKCDAI